MNPPPRRPSPQADPPAATTQVPSVRALWHAHAALVPAVAVGGALGSLGRWWLSEAVGHGAAGLAWTTFGINVVGSFALGVVVALSVARWPHHRFVRPFLGAGVLGGFTTFSTWMLDVHAALSTDPVLAVLVLAATVACGLLAGLGGWATGRWAAGQSLEGAATATPTAAKPTDPGPR